jgi:hypothetical protein
MFGGRSHIVVVVLSLSVSACGVEDSGLVSGVVPGNDDAASSGVTRPPPPIGTRVDAAVDANRRSDAGAPDAAVSPIDAVHADAASALPDAAPDLRPPPPDAASSPPDAAPPPPPRPGDPLCPADPALALCLPFEGNAGDQSGRRLDVTAGNVGFVDGPAGLAADVRPGTVIQFGADAAFDSSGLTVEAWVDARSLSARAGLVDSNGRFGLFALPSGNVYCVGGGTALASGAIRPGVWVSLACTFDAREIVVYVNGRAAGRAVSTFSGMRGNAGVSVGSDNPSGHPLDGFIDNVRIWNGVRTPAQICAGARDCQGVPQGP